MQELDTKSLLQVSFLFGLNNPKQPLCARTSFKNKVIRYFEIILFEILEKVYSAVPRDFFAIPLVTYLVKY